jgi:hypothetical protein
LSTAIYTTDSSFFAAPDLAYFLDADLYVDHNVGLYKNKFIKENIITVDVYNNEEVYGTNIYADHLIIINTIALKQISFLIKQKWFKKVTLIVSDSNATKTYDWWTKFVKKYNIDVYVMPDKIPYCKNINFKPIYQFMNINNNYYQHIDNKFINKKNNILTIGHSASTSQKAKTKGTFQIEKFINELQTKYNINYLQIIGKHHEFALLDTEKCDIFIDQLIYNNPYIDVKSLWDKDIEYKGGIGKSGLEAMHLKCCVVSGGEKYNTEPYFETPPIIWVKYNDFKLIIDQLLNQYEKIQTIANKQYDWIKNYSTKEFAKKYLNVE